MRELNFKSEISGLLRTPRQLSETAQSLLTINQERLTYLSNVSEAPPATRPVLLLEKFTGAMLGGAAVTLMTGNLLVCVTMMLFGPGVIFELLAKIT
jgi:predicted lipid-binding transport protein (Tim44 family)